MVRFDILFLSMSCYRTAAMEGIPAAFQVSQPRSSAWLVWPTVSRMRCYRYHERIHVVRLGTAADPLPARTNPFHYATRHTLTPSRPARRTALTVHSRNRTAVLSHVIVPRYAPRQRGKLCSFPVVPVRAVWRR